MTMGTEEAGASANAARRLLIVEDERIVAFDLSETLHDLGYVVVASVATSDEALSAAREHLPDLVLMDIRISGDVDGIQTAARIRELHEIPVVYLTANADSVTLERALKTEPGGYLAKPYNQLSLRTTIEVALKRHESEVNARQKHQQERRQLEESSHQLRELAERLRLESTLDPLTGLYNRRHLDKAVKRELSLASRKGYPVSFILLDLDRFKLVNDTYGHLAGDAALKAVADLIRSGLREYDVPCRFGGEEIVIVVPGALARDAGGLAERLRAGVELLEITHEGKSLSQVTASFGVSAFPAHGADPASLLAAADHALYEAKRGGRNRVNVASVGPA